MKQFHYPATDITTLPTQTIRAMPLVQRSTGRRRVMRIPRVRTVVFGLRVCGLLLVIAIYATALALYLPTVKMPGAFESAAPTPVEYPCAHITVLQTGPKAWVATTDYACAP